MFREHIPQINKDIQRTKRAIISIGCSFVQGHGAITQEIYDNYNWEAGNENAVNIHWNLTKTEKEKLLSEYPDIIVDPFGGFLDFKTHQHNNSFVNILAKKYFGGDYAAINLGRSGSGNRAGIKELYYYPDILWNDIDECIVIYCPTGAERFDFITDRYHTLNDHGRWETIWPRPIRNISGPELQLWNGYNLCLYSEKFQVLEQIVHVQELILWCKYKNAKLIVVPSFSECYTRKNFVHNIGREVIRDKNGIITKNELSYPPDPQTLQVADMWPWLNMFRPDGCRTFVDLCLKQEFPDLKNAPHFYSYIGKGSPNNWITPCSHPSSKGHDLFAKYLYEELTANPLQYSLKQRIGNL